MVGIVTGQGLGLERSSASVLGNRGQVGSGPMGRGGDQVFVNAATGNLIVNRRDEFLVGRGPDVGYGQTYDSGGQTPYAWMQSHARVLGTLSGTLNTAGSSITRGDGDGHNSLYTYDTARGAYVCTEGGGSYDELRNVGGAWTWTDGDSRMTETYTTLSGVPGYQVIATLSDADGNTQSYSWYSNGTIQRITNFNGEYAEFTQTNGLTTQITTYSAGGAATLTRVRYVWDSLRRLSSVQVDLSPNDHSVADGRTYNTNYYYDGTSGRITAITQTDGSRLDIAYTQSGSEFRVTRLTQTVASGVTRVTGLFYDLPSRTTTITDAAGGATTMRYDAAGNLLQVTHPTPVPGAEAPSASFAYNSNGDVVSVTEAGRTTVYSYDSKGNMILSRDQAGNTVTRTYGAKNELLTSTEYAVADPDGAGAGAAGTPLTTRYAYDSENHLRFKVSGEGRVTEYRYNTVGTLASSLRYSGNLYNVAGLPSTSSISEGNLAAWAQGVADKTTIERTDVGYDFRDNISSTTSYSKTLSDGNGDLNSPHTRINYTYDQAGNLLSRQTLGLSGSETFVYDGLGRIVSSTDEAGAVTTITFNDAATTTTVALAGGTTRVSVFNRAGERISLTESAADIAAATTSMAYDALGRLRVQTDPTGKSTYFFYDAASRKVAEITGDGAMTEFGYDAASRLVKSVSYLNRLSTSQIALLGNVSAGGAGGANSGGVNGPTGSTLLINGSFEQSSPTFTPISTGRSNADLPGWIKANPETFEQVSSGQFGVLASDGSFWLDLESIAKTGTMTVGANLLVNGGFEQSSADFTTTTTGRSNSTLPGWAKTNAETFEQVLTGQMGVAASEGSYWLDMESIAKQGLMVVGSNLLVNGSFGQAGTYVDTATGKSHTSIPGWTKANPETFETVLSGQMGITTLDGGSWLDLESTATTGPYAVGSNLVVNGSFELSTSYVQTDKGRTSTAIPGWSKTNPEAFDQLLAETNPGAPASDGVYSLELDSVPSSGGMVAGPNLIVNGSFEQSASTYTTTATGRMNAANLNIPGWTRASTTTQGFEQVNSGVDGVTTTDGSSFYLDMESGGGAGSRMDISQTVSLTAAKQLTLKFDFANKAPMVPDGEGGLDNSGALEVYWNNILIARIGTQDAALTSKGYTVNGVAGNNTLRFREVGITDGKGVYLDNVQLYGMVAAPNGGNMDVYQTIANRTAGEVMQLQFDYSSRAAATSGSFEVWWNNTLLETIADGGGPMKSKSYFVNAVAGNNTIRFKGIGTVDAVGGTIDNVRLFATQTPPHGGNMDISQTVSGLTAGQTMQLQFDHANRTSAASGAFEVYWNNVLVAAISEANPAMQTKTYQLTAVAGNNTLRFKSLGPVDAAGASLDNVRLYAMAPVPSGGNMDISQTVGGLSAGQEMRLQFDHANRTGTTSGGFEVWWNTTLVATINETNATMLSKTYTVYAIAGNNTLRFKSTGAVDDAGASIDNVRLFATQPVPTGGNMDISQTVGGLAAGQMMQLQFDHANRVSGASGTFEVYWNGALVATVNETGTTMRNKTYYLTAIAGNNTLRFRGVGPVDEAGASIDNVRLFAMQGGGPGGTAPFDPLAGLRPSTSANDDWTWRIYDNADRLIETIDAAGRVTTFAYDGASRLVSTTAYANALSSGTVSGFKNTTPAVTVLPGVNTLTDRTTRSFYDSDGRVVATLDGAGGLTQIFHDSAGRTIREIAYANPVTSASLRATGSLSALLNAVGTTTSDRRVDTVYDRRGLVRFTIDALGHPTEFVYDSAGQLIRTVDYAGQIATSTPYTLDGVQTQIANSSFASSLSNRTTRTVYDGAGRVAFTIDAEGGTTAFAYDTLGNVTKETRYVTAFTTTGDQALWQMENWATGRAGDSGNRVTRRIYDAAGRQAYSVDGEGYVTEQRYDTAGRVTHRIAYASSYSVPDWATKSSLAGQIGSPTDAVTTTYFYDSAGRLTDVVDAHNITTRYVYDGLGQVVDEIAAYNTADSATLRRTYDAAGRVIAETRGFGTTAAATTNYFYDAVGNLLTFTDANGFATMRGYDALGRQTSSNITIDPVTSIGTSNIYNRFGELVRSIDAMGNSTYGYYDRLGRQIAQRDAENYVSETGYNVFGDITSVTRRANPATNTASADSYPLFAASGADATTSFLYDRNGRLTRTTDAEGYYEHYTLDAFGDRVTVRGKLGGLVTNLYDKRGLLVEETLPMASVDADGVTVSSTVKNRFEYDARGNRTARHEAYGLAEQRTTTFVYDKTDRLTETHGAWVYTIDSTGAGSWVQPTERVAYDRRGNVIESVDVLGARTLYYYDRLNRLTAEIGALGTLTTHSYDANGNRLKTRVYGTIIAQPGTAGGTAPTAPGGEYRETSHVYDGLNRMLTTTVASVRTGAWINGAYQTSVGNVTTGYEYDSNGNVIKMTDGNGGITYNLYDKLNRLTGKIDPEGYPTIFEYDAEGNVTKERRYVNRAYNIGTPQVGVDWLPEDRQTDFTYDRNGRRLTEQRNSVVVASLSSSGALSTTTANVQVVYTYNGLGQVTSKTESTGDSVIYGYDLAGRLISEKQATFADYSNASVRPTVRYYYDGLNNLKRTRQGKESLGAADRITRYYHGAGGRLEQMVNAAGDAFYYGYDAAGNVTLETYDRKKSDGSYVSEGRSYSRDVLGRVTVQAMAQWNGSTWARGDTRETSYNAYGEVSQRGINNLGQEQFAYDGAGRLWRTNSGDGVWRYFVYDGNGNQTLAIESEGANLANLSIASALSIAGAGGSVGSAYVDGVNSTVVVYDKRGQAVQIRQPKRQLSETGTAVDLVSYRSYNSFGELASETDARGYTSTFTYNTMGRLTEKVGAWVLSTGEDGAVSWVQPTELFHYDVSGRLIGVADSNGNETARRLLAGTGYGGSEGLVTAEYHEDGGVFRTYYDVYGDARILRNELGQDESRVYDAMGRLVSQSHRSGLVDSYVYDVLGQRIQHWNNMLTNPVYGPDDWVWVQDPDTGEFYWENQATIVGYEVDKELTDYDLQGRVVRQVAFGGDTTWTYYYWQDFATAMGTLGGWTQVTNYANFRDSAVDTDVFGRELYRRDLGGHEAYFTYDLAGRLTHKSGAEAYNYTYLNTGQLATASRGFGSYGNTYELTKSFYSYDAAGNKLTERTTYESGRFGSFGQYITTNTTYQNASASYDALGRMTTWIETGNATTPASRIDYEYDANGNVRRTKAQYRTLDNFGNASSFVSLQDNYYLYDAMNRVAVAKGILDPNMAGEVKIRRGTTGANHAYDQAGRRVSTTRSSLETAQVWDPDAVWWDEYGNQYTGGWVDTYYERETREDFAYDWGGRLSSVSVAIGSYTEDGNGGVTPTPAPSYGSLRSSHTHDAMGRLTRQIDYLPNGYVGYDREASYNNKGQVTTETVINRQGTDTLKSIVTNQYGAGSGYALGAVVSSSSKNYKNNSLQGTSTTSTSYAWYEGAVQSTVTHKPNSSTTYTTSYTYSGSGHLKSSSVADGRPRTITFLNDTNGQTIRRDEADGNHDAATGGDPHEVWYRFNGRQLGYTGNNGTLDTDYSRSVSNRTVVPGSNAFRFGASYGSSHADFDLSVDPINSYSQGGAGGSYTVRSGDTLASIAAQLWGDSSLWYKLAEANGMAGGAPLTEGQLLTIPSGVMKSRHNASTFKPYDPGEIIGDTSPTTPKPGKRGKCGTFGIVLLVVIAVAVTAITAGAAAAALMPTITTLGAGMGAVASGAALSTLGVGTMVAIGAGSAALGSIVSQGVGVATGIQTEFSWKAVGMAAIGGGVGAAFSGAFAGVNPVARGALQGVASNAVTQGIGVVTGLQDKFDWAGVAAAGAGGAVSAGLDGRLGRMNRHAAAGATNAAVAIAGSAARSLVDGSSFGDNLLGALPDAVGTTIGNMVAEGFAAAYDRSRLNARVNRLANSDLLPEELRGAQSSLTLVRDAIGAGADDDMINRLLASEGAAAAYIESILEGVEAATAENGGWPVEPALFQGQAGEFLLTGPRDDYTKVVMEIARRGILKVLADKKTGPVAAEVLRSFLTGTGERHFTFDREDPKTSAGFYELLGPKPGIYFKRDIDALVAWFVNDYLPNTIMRTRFADGDRADEFTRKDFHADTITIGTGKDAKTYRMPIYGFQDGWQLGDVVGTMSHGWEIEVRGGRFHVSGTNSTDLESFWFGNAMPPAAWPLKLPAKGPMSEIFQTFKLSFPVPKRLQALGPPPRRKP